MPQNFNHDGLARLMLDAGRLAADGAPNDGAKLIEERWPHQVASRARRSASPAMKLKVFRADGFRCRYTGDLLLFPATLTALSVLMPDTLPTHRNGKAEEAHEVYWTHFPSLEHVAPVATGGVDAEDNWITTSMARNQVRSRYRLEALGWKIRPREPLPDWDGGLALFMELVERRPDLLADPMWGKYLTSWHRVGTNELAARPAG